MAELSSARGILGLFWVYERFGRLPFRICLLPVVLYYFVFKPRQRRASLEYLQRCHHAGAFRHEPGLWESFLHFLSFGEALLDKFVAWNDGFSRADVEFHGQELIRAALDAGQGVVLLGSHLGNLEVCRVLSRHRQGLRLRVLVHTRHAPTFNRLLERINPNSQVSLQQVTEIGVAEAAELAAWVSAGGVVLIAGDRVPVLTAFDAPAARVSWTPFLSRPAPFPRGPFILANVLDCPVFLLFCVRRGRRFHITFEAFSERLRLPRKDRERALDAQVARFAERLERACLAAPFQWFNFFPFWSQHEA